MGASVTVSQIVDRIRAEYLEMPGTTLRVDQVARLCGVDSTVCRSVLDALVEARFLYVRPDGAYVRATDAPSRRRAAPVRYDRPPGVLGRRSA